jgi:hypothetical protein
MPFRRNRLVAWIAAVAVLLQALWPLLSHARPKDPALLVPICTIDGVTHFLEIKAGKTPLEERTSSHGEHCKLCVFGDGKGVALVAIDFSPFTPENRSSRESGTSKAFIRQVTLYSAHPRAPPVVS